MRFIDEVKVEVRAGNGGKGCSSFRREKYVPRGGPDGGDGGRGGHVIFVASARKNTLQELYLRKRLIAKNGQSGMGSDCHGKYGADVVMEFQPARRACDLGSGRRPALSGPPNAERRRGLPDFEYQRYDSGPRALYLLALIQGSPGFIPTQLFPAASTSRRRRRG